MCRWCEGKKGQYAGQKKVQIFVKKNGKFLGEMGIFLYLCKRF